MANTIVVIVSLLILSLAVVAARTCWLHRRRQQAITDTDLEDPGRRPSATTTKGSEDKRKTTTAKGSEDKGKTTTAKGSEDKGKTTTAKGSEDKGKTTTTTGSEDKRKTTTAKGSEDKRKTTTTTGSEDKRKTTTATGSEDKRKTTTAKGSEDKRKTTTTTGSEDKRKTTTAKGSEDKRKTTTTTGSEDKRKTTTAKGSEDKRKTTTTTGSEDPGTRPTTTTPNDPQTTGGGTPPPPTTQPGLPPTGRSPADRTKRKSKETDDKRKSTTATSLAANQQYTVAPNLVMGDTTIEIFLEKVAKEHPMRFTAKELAGYTRNNSTRLGFGSFGKVYKGTLPLSSRLDVAVKVLDDRLDPKTSEQQFKAEMSTIGRTHHINLVRLYGFCFDGATRALVYELMEHGSLGDYLSAHGDGVTFAKVAEIATGVARGLRYLHEECQPKILHLDIKPANVLLDGSLTPKLADFGLARLFDRDDTHVTVSRLGGTFGYAPPEVCLDYDHRLTEKGDVYSFGMLLLYIIRRGRNLQHMDAVPESESSQQWFPMMAWTSYEAGKLMELVGRQGEDECTELVESMCKVAFWCVQRLPPDRPSMSKVVKMLEGGKNIDPPPNPFKYLYGQSN